MNKTLELVVNEIADAAKKLQEKGFEVIPYSAKGQVTTISVESTCIFSKLAATLVVYIDIKKKLNIEIFWDYDNSKSPLSIYCLCDDWRKDVEGYFKLEYEIDMTDDNASSFSKLMQRMVFIAEELKLFE